MRDGPGKTKGARRVAAENGPGRSPALKQDRPDGTPARGPQLVHDVRGSLAAISLHLHMAAADDLPPHIAERVRDSLEAVRLARGHLAELAEIVERLDKRVEPPPAPRGRTPESS
jgi:hypothetical protein